MKATRLVVCYGPNPAFDKAAAAIAKARGEKYGMPADIRYEAGTINEHPDVWVLCVLSTPTHAPADAECHAKVAAYLNHPARAAQLAKLKRMAEPEVYKHLSEGMKSYVDGVLKKWDKPAGETAATPDRIDVEVEVEVPEVDDDTLAMFRTDDEIGDDVDVAD